CLGGRIRRLRVSCSFPHPQVRSFPTRRSSDLHVAAVFGGLLEPAYLQDAWIAHLHGLFGQFDAMLPCAMLVADRTEFIDATEGRSEEHTSELQSRENLVCRLLLETTEHTVPST